MKNTFSFFVQRNVLLSFMLTGFMFLLGTNDSQAQNLARGTQNPHLDIAQSFGVLGYALGHFDRDEAIAALTAIGTELKPIIQQHGGTQYQKMKYAYVSNVLTDVQTYSIAVEISILKRLDELKKSGKFVGGGAGNTLTGSTSPQYAGLYNEVVSQF